MMNSSTGEYRLRCSKSTLQNKSEGCFFDLVEKFSYNVDLREFSKCSTDLEKITFCATQFWNSIGVELIFRGKVADEGTRFRLEGNTAFEQGDLQKALLCYCKSVIKTPPGDDLATVFANRSALLYKLKEWNQAIEDAKLAISQNYPEQKRHKLYERMTSAYVHLKNYNLAKVTLGLAEHFSTNADTTFNRQIQKLQKQITEGAASTNSTAELPVTLAPKNRKFKSACSNFDVKVTAAEGRFAVASGDIVVGEEVLVETPFASCLLPERNGSHCHHCMSRLKSCTACEACAYVAFCSISCRDMAKSYHQFECKVLLLLVGSGMSVLPLLAFRIITQQTAESLLKDWDSLRFDGTEITADADGVYDDTSYRSVYNLVGHEKARDPEDFFQRTIMALFLLKCLRLVGYFKINIFTTPEPTLDELRIGSLLLRNLQVLQFNAYEIVESILPPKSPCSKLRLIPVGLGIYTTAAFLNHSCDPNVARYFCGNKLHAIAVKNIPGQGAIEDNYGPMFTKVPCSGRRKILEGRYWFTCACVACQENWPLSKEIEQSSNSEMDTRLRTALDLLESGNVQKGKDILIHLLREHFKKQKRLATTSVPNIDVVIAEEALRLAVASVCNDTL